MTDSRETTDRTIISGDRPNLVWERTIRGTLYRFTRSTRLGLPGVLHVSRYNPAGGTNRWERIHAFDAPGTEARAEKRRVGQVLQQGSWLIDRDGRYYRVTGRSGGMPMLVEDGEDGETCTFEWAWQHWGPLTPSVRR
jgi:hypothetical protein